MIPVNKIVYYAPNTQYIPNYNYSFIPSSNNEYQNKNWINCVWIII